jgi:flavin-dependent dehydrogenase
MHPEVQSPKDLRPKDVAVFGGGPAGAALSCHLARAGYSVLLLESRATPAPKVGEGLPPSARPLLAELGLVDGLSRHRPSYGNVAAWGNEMPGERDFIFSPYGHGWHLDRALFERQLLELAGQAGAELWLGRRAELVGGEPGAWQVRPADTDGRSGGWLARCVVDATGRPAALARRLGARREHADRLLAFAAVFERGADDLDGRTLVEASCDGWWYSALLPGSRPSRRMVVYCTDPGTATRRQIAEAATYCRLLATTTLVGPAVLAAGYALAEGPTGHPAGSSRLRPLAGPGWLAVGDAAMACDPLSSQGLKSALEGARQAASALGRQLAPGGPPAADRLYLEFCDALWMTYRDRRRLDYQLEQRWPRQPFWARRHHTPAAPEGSNAWPSPSASIQPSG